MLNYLEFRDNLRIGSVIWNGTRYTFKNSRVMFLHFPTCEWVASAYSPLELYHEYSTRTREFEIAAVSRRYI